MYRLRRHYHVKDIAGHRTKYTVLQGSAATDLGYGGTFNTGFLGSLLLNAPAKEILKLVYIC